MFLIIFLIPALFIALMEFRRKYFIENVHNYILLAFPWLLGIAPGLIFYTETRFKIVSELLLVPFVALILTNVKFKQQIVEDTEILVLDQNRA